MALRKMDEHACKLDRSHAASVPPPSSQIPLFRRRQVCCRAIVRGNKVIDMHLISSLSVWPYFATALLLIAAAPPEVAQIRYVTDGDTFRLTSGERIRIAGIDASETRADQAKCAAELALGETAKARVTTLLDGRTVGIERVARSYHRTVAKVTLAGRDLATILVAWRVARWWPRSAPKPDWCVGALDRRLARRFGETRRGTPHAG